MIAGLTDISAPDAFGFDTLFTLLHVIYGVGVEAGEELFVMCRLWKDGDSYSREQTVGKRTEEECVGLGAIIAILSDTVRLET